MKVMVTGSAGFIGTHLVDSLIGAGHTVAGLDRCAPNVNASGGFYQECDILDRDNLVEAIRRCAPDAICHLAARTDLDEKENINGYQANIRGVENVIEAIRLTPSIQRAIFTSSQLVCQIGYVPKSDRDYCPVNLYGQSKVLTENIVWELDGGGVEWCLVRPTTVWGPGMSSHYQRFFRMIQTGKYFHVGPSPLFKSYGYVGNIAYQFEKVLTAPSGNIHRKMFYLADYEPISLRNWANAFQRHLDARKILTLPQSFARLLAALGDILNGCGLNKFPFNTFRLNNVLAEYQCDLTETRAVCGPLPFTVDDGIRETVKWLKSLN